MEIVFAKTLTELGLDVDFASWQVVEQKQVTELSHALKALEVKL